MDFEIQRSTRHCASTGREFTPGEEFFSVLVEEGESWVRYDYSREAWHGPPENAVGFWKSQASGLETRRKARAPNDVMLQFFEDLESLPERQDMRYLLALLLIRRRVLRLDDTEHDPQGREVLVLYCPRRDAVFRVPVVVPDESRSQALQEELSKLWE